MSSTDSNEAYYTQEYIEHLLDRTMHPRGQSLAMSHVLTEWAFMPLTDFVGGGGRLYKSVLPELAEKALFEPWKFATGQNELQILQNYITHIFIRLAHEKKIEFGGNYATFNTGLVDKLYNPIFALFERNKHGRPFKWVAFCVEGDNVHRTRLAPYIHNEPQRAKFFESFENIYYDPDKRVSPRFDHLLGDGIRRGRIPPDFLQEFKPNGLEEFLQSQTNLKVKDIWANYARFLKQDTRTDGAVQNRILLAIERAKMRCRWNYKTAIPIYYARFNRVDIVLPLCLVDENKVDAALVMERMNVNSYYAHTIFTLDMAYECARLITRPDSDWLSTKVVSNDIEAEAEREA